MHLVGCRGSIRQSSVLLGTVAAVLSNFPNKGLSFLEEVTLGDCIAIVVNLEQDIGELARRPLSPSLTHTILPHPAVVQRNFSIPLSQRQFEMDFIAYEAFTCNTSVTSIVCNAIAAVFWTVLLIPASLALLRERERKRKKDGGLDEDAPDGIAIGGHSTLGIMRRSQMEMASRGDVGAEGTSSYL